MTFQRKGHFNHDIFNIFNIEMNIIIIIKIITCLIISYNCIRANLGKEAFKKNSGVLPFFRFFQIL